MSTGSRSPLASALSVAMTDFGVESRTTLKVGFLGPLSGRVRAWAEPGLHGCMIGAIASMRRAASKSVCAAT